MNDWLLTRGEILPAIFLMVGAALILFSLIWIFLEYLLADKEKSYSPPKNSKSDIRLNDVPDDPPVNDDTNLCRCHSVHLGL